MKVPYLDLPQQYERQKDELNKVFQRVMSGGDFILRKDVEKFEKNMAKYLGVKYVIGVNSGTDALYLSLKALGLKEGDEVITTALLPYSTFAILNAGAKPILVDVETDFNIDTEKLKEAITPKTKAIIPVYLNGRVSRMDEIMKIAKKYNLKIIEDSAQSLGAKYKGKKSGTFGILGCFSVHPMKNLSCAGDGGFIATNNKQLNKKLRMLRNIGKKERIAFSGFGYNSRLDNLQAAILNIKFKKLDEYIKRRREIAKRYNSKMSYPIIPPHYSKEDTYNSYVIYTKKPEGLCRFLKKNQIESFRHYTKPSNKIKGLNLPSFNLPVTEMICRKALSLPINPSLTNKQIDYVIKKINEYLK